MISDVEITWMLTPFSASAPNMVLATPVWLRMPTPITETWANLQLAHGNVVVFRSLLGISWMWFFGAVFLSQFP